MKASKMYKSIGIIIAIILVALILYNYGSHIPVINKIPFLEKRHQYRPVFSEDGEIDYWTCAMHPSVRLKAPGKCPICGMETVPVLKKDGQQQEFSNQSDAKDQSTNSDSEQESAIKGHDHSAMGVQTKPGDSQNAKSTFTVSPERQQLIGIKTMPVAMRNLDKEIRTVGKVTLDESKIYNVQTKYAGWIEKVFADFRWMHVKKGQPLFTIYSPELVTAQEEYLLALKSKNILSDSRFEDISQGASSLLRASRRRLEFLGVAESQIRELERTGEVQTNLTVYSSVKGHIAQKNAFENMYVEPNTVIYKIADHTTAWVEVDIYENEIPLVKLGDKAEMTLTSLPGENFEGEVTFIWPHLDPETRTVKVRLEFPNPDLKLLPEMYADVSLAIPVGKRLTIPDSAVLRTGKNDLVFVDKGDGNIEVRKVELGQKARGYYEVLKGLKSGEEVVSSANFLIDAESKVQAAVATWGEPKSEENHIKNLDFQEEESIDADTSGGDMK